MDISFLLNKPEPDPTSSLDPVPHPTVMEYASVSQLQGDVHNDVGTPIPQLPLSLIFDTYDELFAFLRDFHINNGAAIVKASSGTQRDIDGTLQPTWIKFKCDRGPQRQSQSAGLRKSSTQKIDCPVTITASATKSSN